MREASCRSRRGSRTGAVADRARPGVLQALRCGGEQAARYVERYPGRKDRVGRNEDIGARRRDRENPAARRNSRPNALEPVRGVLVRAEVASHGQKLTSPASRRDVRPVEMRLTLMGDCLVLLCSVSVSEGLCRAHPLILRPQTGHRWRITSRTSGGGPVGDDGSSIRRGS